MNSNNFDYFLGSNLGEIFNERVEVRWPELPRLDSGKESEHEGNSTVESNRNKFFADRGVLERYTDTSLPAVRPTLEPIARQFHTCEYFRTRDGYLLVLHTADYRDDAQWLWRHGFELAPSLFRPDRYSFAKLFRDAIRMTNMIRNVAAIAEKGLRRTMLEAGLSVYVGKILHVTTGSGKTTLRRRVMNFNIVDVDDVIVEEITRQFPYFRLKKVPPVENIFKFCKNMSPEEVSLLMNSVRSRMAAAAATGSIVLSGNLNLMDMADYVLVQRNRALWKELFDHDREVQTVLRLGKQITFIDDFLENVLSCNVDQI